MVVTFKALAWLAVPAIAVMETLPDLGGVPIVGITAPTLVALFVIGLFRGDIVPRRTHQDVIDERNTLREALRVSEEARLLKDGQMEAVKEIAGAITSISRGIDRALEARP